MTHIYLNDHSISCVGHAGDKIACAMLTAITYSLVDNIVNRLDYHDLSYDLSYDLEPGLFIIDYTDAPSAAMELVEAFKYSICRLAEDYPDNFKIDTTKH